MTGPSLATVTLPQTSVQVLPMNTGEGSLPIRVGDDWCSLIVPWAAIALALGFLLVRRGRSIVEGIAYRVRHRTLRGSSQGRIRLADHEWTAGTSPEDDDDEVSIASFLTARAGGPAGGTSSMTPPPTAILLSPPLAAAADRPKLAPRRAGSSESDLFAVGESGDEGARELPERVETGDLPTLDDLAQEGGGADDDGQAQGSSSAGRSES